MAAAAAAVSVLLNVLMSFGREKSTSRAGHTRIREYDRLQSGENSHLFTSSSSALLNFLFCQHTNNDDVSLATLSWNRFNYIYYYFPGTPPVSSALLQSPLVIFLLYKKVSECGGELRFLQI